MVGKGQLEIAYDAEREWRGFMSVEVDKVEKLRNGNKPLYIDLGEINLTIWSDGMRAIEI